MAVVVVTEEQVSKPTGSLVNNLMVGGKQPEPVVGMGATICCYTDRKAGTVVAIERFKTGKRAGQVKAVTVQEDHAKRLDKNGISESQEYEYTPDPNGPTYTFKVNQKGQYGGSGNYLALGFRQKYHDYSF